MSSVMLYIHAGSVEVISAEKGRIADVYRDNIVGHHRCALAPPPHVAIFVSCPKPFCFVHDCAVIFTNVPAMPASIPPKKAGHVRRAEH
jgi:hypothetical protein